MKLEKKRTKKIHASSSELCTTRLISQTYSPLNYKSDLIKKINTCEIKC